MSPKMGKNDEARERSRRALLQAGAGLMVENASRNPFASLRLRGICERAGDSTGAFYLHWDNLEEYYTTLAKHLAADEEAFEADFDELEEVAERNSEAAPLTAITRVADRDFELLLGSRSWDAMELLNITWGRTRLQAEMTHGYQLLDRSTGQAYAAIFARRGREPRPPFDWDRIGAIIQGVIEGLGLRYKIDPAAVPQSADSDPGLYATTVAALLAVLTRPAGDDASVYDAIQAILADNDRPLDRC